jgi:apolipoprotein N-acyltransferase
MARSRRPEGALPRVLAGAALGGLHAASFVPPLNHWWLQIGTLSLLMAMTVPDADRVPRHRMLTVAAFGFAWFAGGLAWLHTSMHVYGGMPWLLAATAVALFSAYLAAFPALAVAVAHWVVLARSPGAVKGSAPGAAFAHPLALAGCWGFSEWLRGYLFTGFPWLASGYAHVDSPLAGYAPWLGVYGIGALATLVAALLAVAVLHAADGARRAISLVSAVCAAAVLLAGAGLARLELTEPDGSPVSVRLVQGNVPQQLKFDRNRSIAAMNDYAQAFESSHAALTVMPETAWTLPWSATPPDLTDRILRAAARNASAVAIGMPLPSTRLSPSIDGLRYTNSVALIGAAPRAGSGAAPVTDPAAIVARYDKRHLVPFGEFIPTGFAWFVALMDIPLGEFARGVQGQPPFAVAGQRFAFNICYEDLFGEELLDAIRSPGNATVLVNVSNIAWFGDSQALPQHLAIARMRTLETGRPMLRATNTGVTAAIDHRGRVVAQLPYYENAILDVTVQGTTGLTPFVRAGNAAALGCCLVFVGLAWVASGTRRGPKKLK